MWMMLPLHFIITSQMQLDLQTAHIWKAEDTAPFIWIAAYLLGTGMLWDVVGEPLTASTLGAVLKWMLIIYAGLAGLIGSGVLVGGVALGLKKAALDSVFTTAVTAGINRYAAVPHLVTNFDYEPDELQLEA